MIDQISSENNLYKMFTIEQKCYYWIKFRTKKTRYLLENPQKYSIGVVLKRSGVNTSELFSFLV